MKARLSAIVWALLPLGCDAVAGLDGFCVQDPLDSPASAECRRSWPQCGCPEGQTCTLQGNCVPAGTTPIGERCSGPGTCVAGADCITFNSEVAHCYAFCDEPNSLDPSDCAVMGPTSFCGGLIDLPFGYCTLSCDPGRDDETCGPGLTCDIRSPDGTNCRPVGTAQLGESCSEQPCDRGLTCTVNTAGTLSCFIACGPGFAPCPLGMSCSQEDPNDRQSVRPAGPTDWGVCTPS